MKSTLLVFILGSLLSSVGYSDSQSSIDSSNVTHYLKKPTGQYGVGFEEFHWINQNACPDVNFNGKNQADFSPDNTKHCHEIVARIYYPTKPGHQPSSPYYPPLIESAQQGMLKQAISKTEIEQLTKIKSFSMEKAAIIKDKQFPVLLFSPGFSCPTEIYENFITELVSQGYIVVGISTPFINLVALPNGHIVKQANFTNVTDSIKAIKDTFVPLQTQDLIYTYKKLQEPHAANSLFSSMDLKHIGAFGHSIGAWTLVDATYNHPDWFQAIVPIDIGDGTGQSMKHIKDIKTPAMYQISSTRQLLGTYLPVIFELSHNGYLVVISPSELSAGFSQHANFSDLSTLQYEPAYTKNFNYSKKQQVDEAFDFKLMSHYPTKKDTTAFHKTTYILFKQENTWHLVMYFIIPNQPNIPIYFDINRVKGLPNALSALPNKPIEALSDSEIKPIRKIVESLREMMAGTLGTGNGWEITDSINTYLVRFFNTFLKGEENPAFKKCIPLHKDTFMKCGPTKA